MVQEVQGVAEDSGMGVVEALVARGFEGGQEALGEVLRRQGSFSGGRGCGRAMGEEARRLGRVGGRGAVGR